MNQMTGKSYWKTKTLAQMTPKEWEDLCDHCAKCCLEKLEDEDTGEILYTNVACRLLNVDTCLCSDYPNRQKFVYSCVKLTPKKVETLSWLPKSCAYRLVHEGKDLPPWHPLITGDKKSCQKAGKSCHGHIISERIVTDLEEYICDWPSQ